MNVQNAKELTITEGDVRTIHDSGGTQLWGMVAYDTKYAGDATQAGTPTPDAPQAINVVTGEQSVMFLANQNLQPLFSDGSIASAQTMTAGCLTLAQFYSSYTQTLTAEDGKLSTTSTNTSMWKMKFVGLEPSTQYTISATFDVTLNGTDKRFFALGNYRHTQPDHVTGRFSKTITTDASGKWESASSTTDTLFYLYTNSSIVVSDIQLEKASSASDYIPYHLEHNYTVNLGSIELAKIGTYQDYIYKSSGNWYVHKAIGMGSLNGTETWQESTNLSGRKRFYTYTNLRDGDFISGTTQQLCNYGVFSFTAFNYGNVGNFSLQPTGGTFVITVEDTTNLADFKTNLGSVNLIIYYSLATPTDTQITDATLISQLDAIHEWLTRYGYQSSVVGSLPIIISQTNL